MIAILRGRLVPAEEAAGRYGTAFAAVAVLLRERDGLDVLLTKRTERSGDPWSGQWSFPGGRRQGEESLFETASRETDEEVHLRPRRDQLLGCLPARSPANRPEMLVLPFLFHWSDGGTPQPGSEVSVVEWVSLRELAEGRTRATVRVQGRAMEMPAFAHRAGVVWGFTYRTLEDLLVLLG